MPSSRYRSAVWCIEEADTLGRELRKEGYEVVEWHRRRRRDFALFIRLAALMRRKRIDILHCHDELSWFYGVIGAWLGGVSRVLVTMHGRRSDISGRHLWEQRFLANLTTTVVSVSQHLREQIINEVRVSPAKVITIPNGISLEPQKSEREKRRQARAILDLPQDAKVVGAVGRLAAVKNLDLLIAAAAEARTAIPSLYVVLVGDGPCKKRLVEKVTSLGLNEMVIFAGLRRDVEALLPGFDLYICSSDYEGVSLSILEAMAAGKTVIATSVGGNKEIIQHNKTGVLVEKGNRQALSQTLIDLFSDASRRRWLGQQARSVVETKYSINRMIHAYERLYQTMLGISL
jgi:glycosyltransferase involved in cell wall biosynthesis